MCNLGHIINRDITLSIWLVLILRRRAGARSAAWGATILGLFLLWGSHILNPGMVKISVALKAENVTTYSKYLELATLWWGILGGDLRKFGNLITMRLSNDQVFIKANLLIPTDPRQLLEALFDLEGLRCLQEVFLHLLALPSENSCNGLSSKTNTKNANLRVFGINLHNEFFIAHIPIWLIFLKIHDREATAWNNDAS